MITASGEGAISSAADMIVKLGGSKARVAIG